jgi:hypothetical protein
MAHTVLSSEEIFIYALGAIAVAFLAFIGAGMWRQGTRIERAIHIITEVIARSAGLSPAVSMPVPARSAPIPAPSTARRAPSPRPDVAREERLPASGMTDDDAVDSEDVEIDGGIPTPKDIDVEGTCAALKALYGVGDPLELLRAIESELAALGALAEASHEGDAAEFLDVPGALGPTLSLASRQIGVALDLLERRALPPQPEPCDPLPDEPQP